MLAHNIIEPTVIDEELLSRCASEQASGDAADIARKEGIDLSEITSLRLDYKNILRIEHLWQLTSLTKLQLDNNIIEKISGLDHLINLRWLDLSFNNITIIEGLDKLVNLTDLSLYNNRISQLDGLDKCTKLIVLSIGNNDITDMHKLAYLSKFQHLRLLNVSGNPLCQNPDYRLFILSRLKYLQYLDYRLVDTKTIELAREKYIDDIIAIEEEQKIVTKNLMEIQQKHNHEQILTLAFLPGINNLFQSMFESDQDYARILPLARETLIEIQSQYCDKSNIIIKDLITIVLEHHDRRVDEVNQFAYCIQQTIDLSDYIGQQQLNTFLHDKKLLIKEIISTTTNNNNNSHISPTNNNETDINQQHTISLSEQFRQKLTKLTDDLLHNELILVEQFEDLSKEFERNYIDMCSNIKEQVAAAFTRLRELENELHEKIVETVTTSMERQAKSTDVDELDDTVRDLLRDKDAVINHLTGSHDMHMSRIDAQEEAFVSGLNRKLDTVINQVHRYEIDRNRARLREIVVFSERSLQELELAEENGW